MASAVVVPAQAASWRAVTEHLLVRFRRVWLSTTVYALIAPRIRRE